MFFSNTVLCETVLSNMRLRNVFLNKRFISCCSGVCNSPVSFFVESLDDVSKAYIFKATIRLLSDAVLLHKTRFDSTGIYISVCGFCGRYQDICYTPLLLP